MKRTTSNHQETAQSDEPRKRAKKPPATSRGFYVYCIGERAFIEQAFGERLPDAIEAGAPVEMVESDDLAAVVSAVPLADYAEQPLQAHLNDATWTASRAMRHERVVEHFAARATIVPLRFGTIYLSRKRVREMLSGKREHIGSLIARLRDRQEWGINVCRDREALMKAITSFSPRLRELDERARSAPPGQSYLLRRKIETLKADEMRAETERAVAEIQRELANPSDGATSLRLLKGEASEQGEVVAKLAFLVPRARLENFRSMAERLARKYSDSGFRLELTGPWPAYNFSVSDSHD